MSLTLSGFSATFSQTRREWASNSLLFSCVSSPDTITAANPLMSWRTIPWFANQQQLARTANHHKERRFETMHELTSPMKLPKEGKKTPFWSFLLLVLVVIVVYATLSKDAWDFLNNLVATLAGIAIGVPVGLFVSRRQAEQEEAKRLRTEADERKKRVTKIVSLLQRELRDGLTTLKRSKSAGAVSTWTGYNPIKIELWQAFSDGGEIEWIDDPDLLDKLAAAYHHLRLHSTYQDSMLEVRCNAAYTSEVFKEATAAIVSLISQQIDESIQVVTVAEL
jgi:hypothetical protein